MPEDKPALGGGPALIHVQIRAADAGGGDLDDGVVRVLQLGPFDLADGDLERAVVVEGLHLVTRHGGRSRRGFVDRRDEE